MKPTRLDVPSSGRRRRRCSSVLAGALAVACGGDEPPRAEETAHEGREIADAGASEADMAARLRLEERDFPLTIWAAHIIQEDYYDATRVDPKGQLAVALDELGLHTPEFFGVRENDRLRVTVKSQEQSFELAEVRDLRGAAEVLEQVLVFAASTLDLEGEPRHELEYAAINGFLSPLDPHTILLTPDETADLGVKTKGQFGGIGAEVRPEARRLVVVRVLPDSPAALAGLRAGDLLLEIDRQSTVNVELDEAQKLLRGPVDTTVEIKVKRDGKALVLRITRGVIHVESVRTAMLPGAIAYLQIAVFQEDTVARVEEALASMKAAGLTGLILDLRGNSGGLLMQAAGLLDLLTTEGELVIVRSAKAREAEKATSKLLLDPAIPVVAMVDEGTASAAEIVSGAIKHLGRGVVVGRASFGKGTVQMLRDAQPYGRPLALKMTVAEYRVAGDRQVQSVGVRPDLVVEPVRLSGFAGVANYYDRERFEREREIYKTRNLPSAIHDQGADAFVGASKLSLRVLDDLDLGELRTDDAEVARVLADAEVRVARRVALGLVGVSSDPGVRGEVLSKLADELRGEQDAKISAAIGAWQIDWRASAGAAADPVALRVTATVLDEGPIVAGQPFSVRVEVTNDAPVAVERVHVVTDCEQAELDGIELLMGRIEPGASATREIQLQVMPWHADSSDALRFEAHAGDPGAEPDARTEVALTTRAAPRPGFAFDYWIVDDPVAAARAPARPDAERVGGVDAFAVRGNGDGLVQPGEQVLFAFRVDNTGPGAAPDARVVLRNLSGAQGLLEEGELVGGRLAAGASVTGSFGITMSESADPALELELELVVGDGRLRESLRRKIRLKVLPGRAALVLGGAKVRVAAAGSRLYAGADSSAQVVRDLAAGTPLSVIGSAGEWLAVDLHGHGRRAWIPKDGVETGGKGGRVEALADRRMVDPPRIELGAVASTTHADTIDLTGTVRHPGRVRDVVVLVRHGGEEGRDHKAYYLANPEVEGDGGRSLTFTAKVPLKPGSNRIRVIARDGDRVERRQDLWVRRD